MFDKMKQLMEMKKQADRIKRELDGMTVEVDEGNGIRVEITGSQNFRSIAIDESLLTLENKGKLEADLLRSANAAITKSQQMAAKQMASVMPGL
ncbi:MAG: YbaB/EbfC family nucleoid-associated protein [Candidatus Omnitrophica bacterium]|nr:YbaB/EbfC family nucleoid-associated protein [Candidatus Omnitrophota bacterium]